MKHAVYTDFFHVSTSKTLFYKTTIPTFNVDAVVEVKVALIFNKERLLLKISSDKMNSDLSELYEDCSPEYLLEMYKLFKDQKTGASLDTKSDDEVQDLSKQYTKEYLAEMIKLYKEQKRNSVTDEEPDESGSSDNDQESEDAMESGQNQEKVADGKSKNSGCVALFIIAVVIIISQRLILYNNWFRGERK